MEEKTKVCRKCGRELPLSEFPRNALSKDGHINTCKTCKANYEKSHLITVREKARLYDKAVVNGGGFLFIPRDSSCRSSILAGIEGH